MNIAQIEANLQKLIKSINKEIFIYERLLAHVLPKATSTWFKQGSDALSLSNNEVALKKKLSFKEEFENDKNDKN